MSLSSDTPRAELDSHADTCCFGDTAYIVHQTDQTVTATPFIDSLGSIDNAPIVTAAIAYDDPITYQTFILFFPQSIYFPRLEHPLLCPNQMRAAGIVVNDVPLLMIKEHERKTEDHSVISSDDDLHIPLRLQGTVSYFHIRKPTQQEVQSDRDCIHVMMTQEATWDPSQWSSGDDEDAIRASLSSQRTISSINIHGTHTSNRKGTITPDVLAQRWRIGTEAASRTLEATTQLAIRDFRHSSGTRRLNPYAMQLRYRRLNTQLYADTMHAKTKSIRGNKCAMIYCTPFHWVRVYPMAERKEAHRTLDELFRDHGIPHTIIPDNAKELVAGEFRRKLHRAQVSIRPIEAYIHNQNKAEATIRELRRHYRRLMTSTNTPEYLWDYCFEYCAEIRSHTALAIHDLHGETPATILSGDTADISHIAEFGWFDFVWYINIQDASMNVKQLGRYLGPSRSVGDAMCSYILTANGVVVSKSSVLPLSHDDTHSDVIAHKCNEFMDTLRSKWKQRMEGITIDDDGDDVDDTAEDIDILQNTEPLEQIMEPDDVDSATFDKYIATKVILPAGDEMQHGTVKQRKRDTEGHLIGRSHPNPMLDTAQYEVEFLDGHHEVFSANQIAENIYARIDDDGYTVVLMDEIIDHKRLPSISSPSPHSKSTKGWKLCIRWKDGSTSWIHLRDAKEADPVRVAEYAADNKLINEPAFKWWVPHTLRKRQRIIMATKRRHVRKNEMFGVELPTSVCHALAIDAATGTDLWRQAIAKEMKAVRPAFDIKELDTPDPVGYQYMECHMIFAVKVDLTRKARLVAGGHMTEAPATITYASVVSRESVRIAFLIAALNDLDILAADVQNAYLNAPCRERIYTRCGPEFGSDQGKIAIICRALYGLKSSGAAWRAHLAETLRESLGFTSCRADSDVWMKPAVASDGSEYYEYVLMYTDDILAVSKQPRRILDAIDSHFFLKPSSIGPPTTYLGSTISQFHLTADPSRPKWSMGSQEYIKSALKIVTKYLTEHNLRLKTKAPSVLPNNYRPELDGSQMCDTEQTTFYQQLIGILRWTVELGRIDVCCETSMMASYCVAPRIGHLHALFHMFAYLKSHDRSRLVFDDAYIDKPPVMQPNWNDFYPDAHEQLPADMPPPRGKEVQMTCFVDADHAGDRVTRRSRTGVLLFLNTSPILWYSKKQNSIETSTFGSEFTALKVATEIIIGMRYKLRMMGIPLDGPADVRVDNQSVVYNSSLPESQLRKKANAIAYHFVRESIAAGILVVQHEPSETNLSDMLTKQQQGPRRKEQAQRVLF